MKASKLVLLALISLFTFKMYAQDKIHKTDATVINAKVTEVNATAVKYKLTADDANKVFELDKSEINYIQYNNGTKEFFTSFKPGYVDSHSDEIHHESKDKKDYGKNIIAINCFDMFFTNFSVSYERILSSGTLSIKIPLSIGLQGKPNKTSYKSDFLQTQFLQNRNYAIGLDLNIYPFGQTKHTFYVGISTYAGSFNYYKDSVQTTPTPYGYYTTTIIDTKKYTGNHYSGMLHIGGYLGLGESFMIGAKLGVGFKREDTIEDDYTLPTAEFDFNLAYRF